MDVTASIKQILQGNRQAFAVIVNHYQTPLFSYLGRMGMTPTQAQDIAQETFLRVWQHLGDYDPKRAQFSTWLFTIAQRLALNALTSAAARLEIPFEDDQPDGVSSGVSSALHAEQLQQQQHLQQAIKRLPLAERNTLALVYTQGLDLKTVAQIEGCTESAIKVRLHRAREHLHQWLGAD